MTTEFSTFDQIFIETVKFGLFGAMVAYAIQALRTQILYQMDGFEKFRAHAGLCWASAFYCFVGLIMFIPFSTAIQHALLNVQFCAGNLTTFHYSRSLRTFLETDSKAHRRIERFALVFAGIGILGAAIAMINGFPMLVRPEPAINSPLITRVVGEVFLPTPAGGAILGLALLNTLALSAFLIKKVFRKDRWLSLGIVFTAIAVTNDIVSFNSGFKYFFPLLYLANAVEIFRITSLAEREIRARSQSLLHSARLAAIGEMAAGIAHEIRNPLAVILMNAELLTSTATEEQKSFLTTIDRSVQRISRIVESLLRIVRADAGSEPVSADLSQNLDEIVQLARIRAGRAEVELMTDIPRGAHMLCRPTEISQAVLNLVNNAIDAVRTLPEKWVKIELIAEGTDYLISVTDSGNGIPPEIAAKIMEPFFTTKPRGEGTGLGLSLTRRFIESHQGSLSIDSSSPHTRFVIRIPSNGTPMAAQSSVAA